MKCHKCGSEYHLQAPCPRKASMVHLASSVSPTEAIVDVPQQEETHKNINFSLVVFRPDSNKSSNSIHTFLRMDPQEFGEGLLVDTGAYDNLMGEQWLRRVQAIQQQSSSFQRSSTNTVEQVTTSQSSWRCWQRPCSRRIPSQGTHINARRHKDIPRSIVY